MRCLVYISIVGKHVVYFKTAFHVDTISYLMDPMETLERANHLHPEREGEKPFWPFHPLC